MDDKKCESDPVRVANPIDDHTCTIVDGDSVVVEATVVTPEGFGDCTMGSVLASVEGQLTFEGTPERKSTVLNYVSGNLWRSDKVYFGNFSTGGHTFADITANWYCAPPPVEDSQHATTPIVNT